MPFFFLDASGNYYETLTDRPTPDGHTAVSQRPQPWSEWVDGAWVTGDAPAAPVPQLVRKLALVKACRQTTWGESDLWTQAKAALALQSDEVQEDWDLAVEIPRDDPAFVALATALGATSDDIDDVFRLAGSLQ